MKSFKLYIGFGATSTTAPAPAFGGFNTTTTAAPTGLGGTSFTGFGASAATTSGKLILLMKIESVDETFLIAYAFFFLAPTAFGGFGATSTLGTQLGGGFGVSSAAPSFSFNTPSFGAPATQATSSFSGFGSSKFYFNDQKKNILIQ